MTQSETLRLSCAAQRRPWRLQNAVLLLLRPDVLAVAFQVNNRRHIYHLFSNLNVTTCSQITRAQRALTT